jgi:toxin ParE2
MRLRVHALADSDDEDAYQWYAAERRDLAEEFTAELEAGIEAVLDAPHRWPAVARRARYYRLRRFPYGLVYQVGDGEVFLVSIAHVRRRPGFWRDRLEP